MFAAEEARHHRLAAEVERQRRETMSAEAGESTTEKKAADIDISMDAWLEANPAPRATLEQVADHIDYLRDAVGVDGVGIGSDFDGITMVPVGLEDVSTYPALITELLRRGYSTGDTAKVAGQNLLRLMREVEGAAIRITAARPPADALF